LCVYGGFGISVNFLQKNSKLDVVVDDDQRLKRLVKTPFRKGRPAPVRSAMARSFISTLRPGIRIRHRATLDSSAI